MRITSLYDYGNRGKAAERSTEAAVRSNDVERECRMGQEIKRLHSRADLSSDGVNFKTGRPWQY